MKIGSREIGEKQPVFVIAEAGINHNGSVEMALEMIKVAKACGADAVKFQKRSMESLYRTDVLADPGRESHGLGVYVPMLKKFEFDEETHRRLRQACLDEGIMYLCSPWDIPSANFLMELGIEAFKVPSACFSDLFLTDHLAKTGKPAILSTGMHEAAEVEQLVWMHVSRFGLDNVAFLHCTSSYPTANKDVNLQCMTWLKERTKCVVGYSGHERGIPITVAAVALGAAIVERHFTLDRTLPGPDHAASLESHGLETLVRHIRAVEEAMGSRKAMNRGEIMARETLGKVLTWATDMKPGDTICPHHLKAMSPGHGVPVQAALDFIGKTVKEDVRAGAPVRQSEIRMEGENA